jgi:hypothetical protein
LIIILQLIGGCQNASLKFLLSPYSHSPIFDHADQPWPLTIHAENWAAVPAPEETQDFGSHWFEPMNSVAIVVSSAVMISEENILLNSLYENFAKLERGKSIVFRSSLNG